MRWCDATCTHLLSLLAGDRQVRRQLLRSAREGLHLVHKWCEARSVRVRIATGTAITSTTAAAARAMRAAQLVCRGAVVVTAAAVATHRPRCSRYSRL